MTRNQTLDINIPLADSFNGDINLSHNTTLDMSATWTMAGGTIDVNNGAVGGFPATPAGTAAITGAAFTQTAGTITVEDTDGTLQFDGDFLMPGGNLVNNGHVIFNSNAAIGAAANFTMPGANSSLTVKANAQVFVVQMNSTSTATALPPTSSPSRTAAACRSTWARPATRISPASSTCRAASCWSTRPTTTGRSSAAATST